MVWMEITRARNLMVCQKHFMLSQHSRVSLSCRGKDVWWFTKHSREHVCWFSNRKRLSSSRVPLACSLQRIGRSGMHQSVSHRMCIALCVAQKRNAQLAHGRPPNSFRLASGRGRFVVRFCDNCLWCVHSRRTVLLGPRFRQQRGTRV